MADPQMAAGFFACVLFLPEFPALSRIPWVYRAYSATLLWFGHPAWWDAKRCPFGTCEWSSLCFECEMLAKACEE